MKILGTLLLIVIECRCAGVRKIDLQVVSVDRASIAVEVLNGSEQDIVVLNPEAPTREVDQERCQVILSTRVTDDVRPYAFTPELETVRAGSTRRFRASLNPLTLTKTCHTWTVNVEYAYVLPRDVEMFKSRVVEEFRLHTLQHQKLMSTSSVRTIND